MLEAENNLRFSLGRYLHDKPQQQLQLALAVLKEQAELIESDRPEAQRQMAETNRRLRDLLGQADRELSQLRREVMGYESLVGGVDRAVESYVLDELQPEASFEVRMELAALRGWEEGWQADPVQGRALTMFVALWVREGLKNIYKHAGASLVQLEAGVVWNQGSRYLRLSIKDNGQGFDLARLEELSREGRHRSFAEFEARAQMLGGYSRLTSAEGLGTLWEIYLPVWDERKKLVALSA